MPEALSRLLVIPPHSSGGAAFKLRPPPLRMQGRVGEGCSSIDAKQPYRPPGNPLPTSPCIRKGRSYSLGSTVISADECFCPLPCESREGCSLIDAKQPYRPPGNPLPTSPCIRKGRSYSLGSTVISADECFCPLPCESREGCSLIDAKQPYRPPGNPLPTSPCIRKGRSYSLGSTVISADECFCPLPCESREGCSLIDAKQPYRPPGNPLPTSPCIRKGRSYSLGSTVISADECFCPLPCESREGCSLIDAKQPYRPPGNPLPTSPCIRKGRSYSLGSTVISHSQGRSKAKRGRM